MIRSWQNAHRRKGGKFLFYFFTLNSTSIFPYCKILPGASNGLGAVLSLSRIAGSEDEEEWETEGGTQRFLHWILCIRKKVMALV